MPYDPPPDLPDMRPKTSFASGVWFVIWLLGLIYGTWHYGPGVAALLVVSNLAVVGWLHD